MDKPLSLANLEMKFKVIGITFRFKKSTADTSTPPHTFSVK